MTRMHALLGCLLIAWCLVCTNAWAIATDKEIARLGKDLTPLGGEMAGNKDGTIPPYEGGITKPPANYISGGYRVDPFADDKILFTITKANMDQYADKLTESHKMMLQKYEHFKMNIYPTHRSAAFPTYIYDATRRYAKIAESDGFGSAINTVQGTPFPIPKNAVEVQLNHNARYQGFDREKKFETAVVNEDGRYTPQTTIDKLYSVYHLPEATLDDYKQKYAAFYKLYKYSPPRIAGQIVLIHEPFSYKEVDRIAWTYNPGQRRVRRAPNYEYDNPAVGSDGLITTDQVNQWAGKNTRYDWTLIGKKEMYVPYNTYKIISDKVSKKELLMPQHLNPEFVRYELHRVWVFEANLKEGAKHLYKKRRFYSDEDSWVTLVQDIYDNKDQLWRCHQFYCVNYYDVPAFAMALEVGYDFVSRRYFASGLVNETEPTKFNVEMSPNEFTTSAIRQEGTR